MYLYTDFDRQFVRARAMQFRDQLPAHVDPASVANLRVVRGDGTVLSVTGDLRAAGGGALGGAAAAIAALFGTGLELIDPEEATQQQKVMARLAIILAGTSAAQGDAARTADGFANQLKRLLVIFTYNRFLERYRQNAIDLGNDIILASRELARKNFGWHLRAFAATVVAWCCKFLVLMALINGIVPEMDLSFENQSLLFSRVTAMLVIMAFSPTPGGSGFAEYVFGGFLSDFVPKGIALVIATIWRLMAYYSYLLAGAIILPAWIQTHIHLPSLKKSSEDKSGGTPPENKIHP